MLLTNPSFSNFKLVLPPDFLPKEIEKKYKTKMLHIPEIISEPIDLLNHSITGFTMNGFSNETVTQTAAGYSTKREFRNGADMFGNIAENNRDITIEFKHTESYLNWFMMYDLMAWYWNYSSKQKPKPVYLPAIILEILTAEGFLQIGVEFRNVIFKEISGLSLSYTTSTPEFTNFTCEFAFQYLEFYNTITDKEL